MNKIMNKLKNLLLIIILLCLTGCNGMTIQGKVEEIEAFINLPNFKAYIDNY